MHPMAEADRSARLAWVPSAFVRLPENRSAVFALSRLAQRLTRQRPAPVPLLLLGPPGCGKTHLVDDFARWAEAVANVYRLDAAEFPSEVDRHALDAELAVVEDLHHLPMPAADAFCAWWDWRQRRQRATVLTANRGPGQLTHWPARLRSRVCGGLIVTIRGLGRRSRRKFLERLDLTASPEVLDWLSARTPGSGRQLLAAAELLRRCISGQPSATRLSDIQARFAQAGNIADIRDTLERIVRRVADEFQLPPQAVVGRDRQPTALWARQLAMYLARSASGWSFEQIARYFARDPATVRHACRKVARRRVDDPQLAQRLRQWETDLVN